MPKDSLAVTDNRTGKQYELEITNGAIRTSDLRQIKVKPDDFGLMSYDPAFMNTASCKSNITFIDGDKGILRYRGYPIEQLAVESSYLEVAYLLIHGELPKKDELVKWEYNIMHHTYVHENVKKFMDGYHYDAHPMGMFISTMAALSTFYPAAKNIFDKDSRQLQTYRLIGKVATIAAFAYRHSMGLPYAYPDDNLSYAGNFLNMLLRTTETKLCTRSDIGESAGCPVHTSRRPRTELQYKYNKSSRVVARRSFLRISGSGGRPLRPAPWWSERGRSKNAQGDRIEG